MSVTRKYLNYAQELLDRKQKDNETSLAKKQPEKFIQAMEYLQSALAQYLSVNWHWEPQTVFGDGSIGLFEIKSSEGETPASTYSSIRQNRKGYTLNYLESRLQKGHAGVINRFDDALKIFAAGIVTEFRRSSLGHVSWMWQGVAGPEVKATKEKDPLYSICFALVEDPEAWFLYDTISGGGALSHCLAMSFEEWVDTICQYPPVTINDVLPASEIEFK